MDPYLLLPDLLALSGAKNNDPDTSSSSLSKWMLDRQLGGAARFATTSARGYQATIVNQEGVSA